MGVTMEYDPEIDAIHIVYYDEVDFATIAQAIEASTELGIKHNTPRRLIDCTRLKGGERIMDNYKITDKLEEVRPMRNTRLALILPPDPATSEGLKFFETAARNRGQRVRVFETREAAVEWLLK